MASISVFSQIGSVPGLATGMVLFTALYLLAYQMSSKKIHPQEPSVIAPRIPIIGHVLGMLFYGGRYVKNIGLRHEEYPIFTLPVPGSRLYIVTEPSVAASVQRATKALSFSPIAAAVTESILGLDKPTVQIVKKNLDPGPGDEPGFLSDMQEMVYKWLGPGEYLNELTQAASDELGREIDTFSAKLSKEPSQRIQVDLLGWMRSIVSIATAKYLYGPTNPFASSPQVVEAFWDFDHGLAGLLIGIMPQTFAKKAYLGREKLSDALTDYIEGGDFKKASKIVKKRIEIAQEYGWLPHMIAREELSFLFAGIVNATTSTFWIILQIFADPNLLSHVRSEVQEALSKMPQDSETGATKVSLDTLEKRCPVLMAVYRECLRLGSDNSSTRLVKEDTMLMDRYFLKKNAVLQIAGGVIHSDNTVWGNDVRTFNPGRWLDGYNPARGADAWRGVRERRNFVQPGAFRAYGGGKTLCPGRHFAKHEIIGLVTNIVMTYNFESPEGGYISVPKKNDTVLPVHILEPRAPVEAVITPRRDWQGKLKFVLEE